jgi:4-hydroxy-3-methylbut-2-en-1-yl diphosphate synthase IspG/GcpE
MGEREVVELVSCPNCGKKLVELPPNYPLYTECVTTFPSPRR